MYSILDEGKSAIDEGGSSRIRGDPKVKQTPARWRPKIAEEEGPTGSVKWQKGTKRVK